MDYESLAKEFLYYNLLFFKGKSQKNMNEFMHGESIILHYLYEKKMNVIPGEISNDMMISTARIAAILNGLEKKGWISRQIDPEDRRRILVALSQSGIMEAERKQQEIENDAIQMLEKLGEQDAMEYVRITKKLVEITRNKA